MSGSWVIPFNDPGLNQATGVGGVPRGRLTTLLANPANGSSGRSAAVYKLIASEQASGGSVAFIDASSQFDRLWAESLGVRSDRLLLMIPSCLEEVISCIFSAVRLGCSLVVVDEVSDLGPLSEIQNPLSGEDSPSGRLMAHSLRQIRVLLETSLAALVLVASSRVTFRGDHTFLAPAHGRSLLHYASMVLWFDRVGEAFRTSLIESKYSPPVAVGVWSLT